MSLLTVCDLCGKVNPPTARGTNLTKCCSSIHKAKGMPLLSADGETPLGRKIKFYSYGVARPATLQVPFSITWKGLFKIKEQP